jgi:hypothetical protein
MAADTNAITTGAEIRRQRGGAKSSAAKLMRYGERPPSWHRSDESVAPPHTTGKARKTGGQAPAARRLHSVVGASLMVGVLDVDADSVPSLTLLTIVAISGRC